jgi:hypothetical protein
LLPYAEIAHVASVTCFVYGALPPTDLSNTTRTASGTVTVVSAEARPPPAVTRKLAT